MQAEEYIEKAKSLYGCDELGANMCLRTAAKQGSADAFFELAHRYAKGIPFLDMDEARSCLAQASQLGSINAAHALLRCQRMLKMPDEEPDDLLEAIEKSIDMDNFDLNSHFAMAMQSMFGFGEYGAYELQVLKTMAAYGDPLAAAFLADAYSSGEFHENMEPEPLEELRWSLIEKYLQGDREWNNHVKIFAPINEQDRGVISEEVRSWIKEHPTARQAAITAGYKKRFIETGGKVDLNDLRPDAYYNQSEGDLGNENKNMVR